MLYHVADNGFPFDHTWLTMVIASVVFVYNRKFGILFAVISFIVGFSRVLAGIHQKSLSYFLPHPRLPLRLLPLVQEHQDLLVDYYRLFAVGLL